MKGKVLVGGWVWGGFGFYWLLGFLFFFVGFCLLVCCVFYIKRSEGATVVGITIIHLQNFPDITSFQDHTHLQ